MCMQVCVSSREKRAPQMETVALAAHAAAVRQAEAEHAVLEGRLALARSLLSAATRREQERLEGEDALQERLADLRKLLPEREAALETLHEGAAACELRRSLSRQLLADRGQKLEALRARGGITEEVVREKTIQLGALNGRLRERAQQRRELLRFRLEQRVRVGLGQWLPPHLRDAAMRTWQAVLALQREQHERSHGASLLWRASALRRAFQRWR